MLKSLNRYYGMMPFFIGLFKAHPSLTNLNACHTLAKIDVLFHSYKFSPQNRNNLDLESRCFAVKETSPEKLNEIFLLFLWLYQKKLRNLRSVKSAA